MEVMDHINVLQLLGSILMADGTGLGRGLPFPVQASWG